MLAEITGAGGGVGGWSASESSTWKGHVTWWCVHASAPLSGGQGDRSVCPQALSCRGKQG